MGHAVVLTPGGSRVIGQYDGYGNVGSYDLVDQIDEFAMYHKACWELAGKPEFIVPSRGANDQGFCLSHDEFTVPKPTSPEWFTIAQGWHAIRRVFEGFSRFQFELELAAHKRAYRALSEADRILFEGIALAQKDDYHRRECIFEFNGEEFRGLTARLIVNCALRDRGENPQW